MKVREFIGILASKCDPDDELYFTTSAQDLEFVFDSVCIEDKHAGDKEITVYLQIRDQDTYKEYTAFITDNVFSDFISELNGLIDGYR